MSEHVYLEKAAPDQLAALLFELASQLHVERQRRIALETVLERAGLLEAGVLDEISDDAEISGKGRDALDQSVRHLLRILTETGDFRGPLRPG